MRHAPFSLARTRNVRYEVHSLNPAKIDVVIHMNCPSEVIPARAGRPASKPPMSDSPRHFLKSALIFLPVATFSLAAEPMRYAFLSFESSACIAVGGAPSWNASRTACTVGAASWGTLDGGFH